MLELLGLWSLALPCANYMCQNKLQCGPNLISQRPGHRTILKQIISVQHIKVHLPEELQNQLWPNTLLATYLLKAYFDSNHSPHSMHVSCFVEQFDQQDTFTMHTRHPYELLNKTLLAKQILQLFVVISLCLSL